MIFTEMTDKYFENCTEHECVVFVNFGVLT
jgi:hypothetical protein